MFTRIAALSLIVLALMTAPAFATQALQAEFVKHYPGVAATALQSCATCHAPIKEKFLNAYGLALKAAKLDFDSIAEADADGDGKANLAEITALTNPGSKADDSELFIFTSKMAPVKFTHGEHSLAAFKKSGDCLPCHTADGKNAFPQAFDDTVQMKDIAHNLCINCHKASGQATAPVKCLDCHVKAQ